VSRSDLVATRAEPEDLVELGRLSGAYGVRGWVKIQPHAAGSSALLGAKAWWLRPPMLPGDTEQPIARPIRVIKSRTQGSSIVAHLESISDRDQAQELRGHTVWVSRVEFPPVEENEYYWVDLIGCTLLGEEDGRSVLLGVVDSIVDNGAHAILRVHRQVYDSRGEAVPVLDGKGKPVEVLVPFVAAHVHTVDLANRQLVSNWPVEL